MGMNVPSRRMPAYLPRKRGALGWFFAVSALFAVAYSLFANPWLLLAFAILLAVIFVGSRRQQHELEGLIEGRNGESICTFARQFGKDIDTWIVRAVYEQLSAYLDAKGTFPLRAEDRLKEDLGLDDDDLDLDLCEEISQRTGRTLTHFEQNPLHGRVRTVADLVHFFSHQPRVLPTIASRWKD